MIIISDKVLKRDLLASIDFESKVKNLSALFDYVKQEFKEKKYKLDEINDYTLNITIRNFPKKKIISIEDYAESNTISIEIFSENILIPEQVRLWMDKRFLRLKNSVWVILLLLMTFLIPIIVVGYIQERFSMLRIFGIVLLCSAGSFAILYTVLNPLFVKRRIKQKNQASELVNKIKTLIDDYSEKELTGKICWNCFSEIKEKETTCHNCKVSLKK